jgi:hypothetical protein
MTSAAPQKLSESLSIIRKWAVSMSATLEVEKFLNDLHRILEIQSSAGSLERCVMELKRVMTLAQSSAKAVPDMDASQKVVLHIIGLFGIENQDQVISKMNELYVFWAEVNNGTE